MTNVVLNKSNRQGLLACRERIKGELSPTLNNSHHSLITTIISLLSKHYTLASTTIKMLVTSVVGLLITAVGAIAAPGGHHPPPPSSSSSPFRGPSQPDPIHLLQQRCRLLLHPRDRRVGQQLLPVLQLPQLLQQHCRLLQQPGQPGMCL